MTPNQLKAASLDGGFLIRLWLPEEDRVKMIVMMGDLSLPCEVSMVDLMTYLEHGIGTAGVVKDLIGRLTNHQHIVWCKACHEPLLRRVDQELALTVLQHSPKPDVRLVVDSRLIHVITRLNAGVALSPLDVAAVAGAHAEEAIETATQYRSVRRGPYSPLLTTCPNCQRKLSKEIVEEIEDS